MLNMAGLKFDKSTKYLENQLNIQKNNKQLLLDIITNIGLILNNSSSNDKEELQGVLDIANDFLQDISSNITALEQLNLEISNITEELTGIINEQSQNKRTKEYYIATLSNIKNHIVQFTEKFQEFQKKLDIDNDDFNNFINDNDFKYTFDTIESERNIDTYELTSFSINNESTIIPTTPVEEISNEEKEKYAAVEQDILGNISDNIEYIENTEIPADIEPSLEELFISETVTDKIETTKEIDDKYELTTETTEGINDKYASIDEITENVSLANIVETTDKNEIDVIATNNIQNAVEPVIEDSVKNVIDIQHIKTLQQNVLSIYNDLSNIADNILNEYNAYSNDFHTPNTTIVPITNTTDTLKESVLDETTTSFEDVFSDIVDEITVDEPIVDEVTVDEPIADETVIDEVKDIETIDDIVEDALFNILEDQPTEENIEDTTYDIIDGPTTNIVEEQTETSHITEKMEDIISDSTISNLDDISIKNEGLNFELTNLLNDEINNKLSEQDISSYHNPITTIEAITPVEEKTVIQTPVVDEDMSAQQIIKQIKSANEANNILLISETTNSVYLPYRLSELVNYMDYYPNIYKSLQDVVEQEFVLDLNDFMKHPARSRFIETYNLVRNRSGKSVIQALSAALKVYKNRFLNPAIIAACKSDYELNCYLDNLVTDRLDSFNFFKVVYDVKPL